MRILVSGSSGLIGSHLVKYLRAGGHEIVRLVRKPSIAPDVLVWHPEKGSIDAEMFEGFDVVIHLAGSNIAAKRWTKSQKKVLFQSRCRDTWLLAHVLARVKKPPALFLSASAVGFYGDRGDERITEASGQGTGFLADLCRHWEAASDVLRTCGTRVVHARFGAVLSPAGGTLKKLLPKFRLGLGATLGTGEQWFSWIAVDDAVRALYHILMAPEIQGAVNITAPGSLSNRDFSLALAKACHKKLFLRLPALFLRLALGEIADEALLASVRVFPEKLLNTGFVFTMPEIEQALHIKNDDR